MPYVYIAWRRDDKNAFEMGSWSIFNGLLGEVWNYFPSKNLLLS